eukprot:1520797-Karenia_brevis.AAC.1
MGAVRILQKDLENVVSVVADIAIRMSSCEHMAATLADRVDAVNKNDSTLVLPPVQHAVVGSGKSCSMFYSAFASEAAPSEALDAKFGSLNEMLSAITDALKDLELKVIESEALIHRKSVGCDHVWSAIGDMESSIGKLTK